MTFKIVQTSERGKLVLSAVPEKWENNGILYWPRRKVEDLLKDPFSCPEASWSSFECVVKRSGISSLESAEIEVTRMSSMSDTEEEQNEDLQCGGTTIENIAVQDCFNDLANTCVNDSQYLPPSTSNSTNKNVIVLTANQEIDQNQHSVLLHTAEHQDTSQKLDNLLQITGIIQENQKILFEYVQSVETKILMKMTHLSTQIEEYIQRTTEFNIQEANAFKPISDKEELDAFEDQLKDLNMISTLKNKLAVVCGKGKGRGCNNAYALADVMFTRQFMTTCSWAGGSKNSTSKICFKIYTRTINFFFELVRESDITYTKIECENFFKNIMRHAETRNKKTLLRASSSKSRPKRCMPRSNIAERHVLQEIQQNEQSDEPSSHVINNDLDLQEIV